MRLARPLSWMLLMSLVTAGCANELIGRRIPDCDLTLLTSEIVMQAQAVPTATVGPCVLELEPGWEYEHQEAQTGLARFWLSSDRLGERFVEVRLQETCDPGNAIHRRSPFVGVDAFLAGSPYVDPVRITIVPASSSLVTYAASIGVALSAETADGHPFDLVLEDSPDPAVAVAEAVRSGRFVITVDRTDAAYQTMELIVPNEESHGKQPLEHVIDEIEEQVDAPRYQADWYFVFEGGCIVWNFDAEGEMVESLSDDIDRALGFYDLGGLRRQMNELGFYTGP